MIKNIWMFVIVAASTFSINAFSGELLLRDGYIKPGCAIVRSGGGQFVFSTLNCDGKDVATISILVHTGAPGHQRRNTVDYDHDMVSSGGMYLFGTISVKGAASVFINRPLSVAYKAYSDDGVLDKPVIVVEGYDPENNINPDYYYNYGFNQLVTAGRDVIIVNFPNGSGNISDNAVLLQNIIQEINAAKTGDFPTVVIGYSMGGIVARKALKNMELAGIDHKTSLYVSYDAPHLGANAPLALQETVEDLIKELSSKVAGKTDSGLKRARNVYNSPAAREMLIAGPDFRNAIEADFPKSLARVAVTSGSLLGINGMQANSTYEGEYVADFRFYLYKNWSAEWSNTYRWFSKKRDAYYYDNVPGSYEQQFRDAYFALKNGADSFGVNLEAKPQNITFVPTISSLAMPVGPTNYLKDIFRVRSPFDMYIAVDEVSGLSACEVFAYQIADGKNLIHHPINEYLNYNQLMQLKCALDMYQVSNFSMPDRSFKRY